MKNIIKPFLPVIIFIIVDYFFKTPLISIVTSSLFITYEIIYSLIKYKRLDTSILIDIAFIGILSFFSFAFANSDKLIKGIINDSLIFAILFIFVINKKIIKSIMKNYGFTTRIDPDFRLLYPIFFIIAAHIAILTYIYFNHMVNLPTSFISEYLLYIMFGIYLIILIGIKFIIHKNTEYFDIIDENCKVIGRVSRSVCHNKTFHLHPVVHVHVVNSQGQLLLQKRSLKKDIQPGKWDTSVGGHISSGETVEQGVLRESAEELGIKIDLKELKFLRKYIFKSEIEREYVFSFLYKYDSKIKFQRDEIDAVRYFSREEIAVLVVNGETTENFKYEFQVIGDMIV